MPIVNLYSNLGVGNWDGYGHKPTGKTTLATQIKFKKTNFPANENTLWIMGYPTNDVILYANNGNMSEDSLTEYLRSYIEQGVRKILAAFPNDKIILDIPCPMVARPDNPQFPSHTAYPNWGTNLSVDSAYMSKWNNSIRNAFYKVKGKFKNTEVYDSWLDAFGTVNTATSATLLPYMNDCVHQNNIGNWKIVDGWIGVAYKPRFKNQSRIQEADSRAALMGNNPWDNEPGYFYNNLKYKAVLYSPVTAVAGSNYIDLTMAKGDWDKYVNGSPVYISVGNSAAQYFPTYSVSQTSGTTIRLTGIAPTTAFQAAIGEVVIYTSATKLLSPDVYVLGRITALSPRAVFPGFISSAGSGYLDVRLDPVIGRPTTNVLNGMNTGRLVIGGAINTDITDLTTGTTINQTGAASGRTMRILKTGDWTSYANTYCAFLFDDVAIPPTAYEARYPYFAQVLHAQNNVMRTAINQNLPAGVTINVANTEVFATNVTVEIFSVRYPNRTSLGTITIPANSGSGSTPIVVSTNVPVKTIYEAVITSATSQTTGLITMTVTPN